MGRKMVSGNRQHGWDRAKPNQTKPNYIKPWLNGSNNSVQLEICKTGVGSAWEWGVQRVPFRFSLSPFKVCRVLTCVCVCVCVYGLYPHCCASGHSNSNVCGLYVDIMSCHHIIRSRG